MKYLLAAIFILGAVLGIQSQRHLRLGARRWSPNIVGRRAWSRLLFDDDDFDNDLDDNDDDIIWTRTGPQRVLDDDDIIWTSTGPQRILDDDDDDDFIGHHWLRRNEARQRQNQWLRRQHFLSHHAFDHHVTPHHLPINQLHPVIQEIPTNELSVPQPIPVLPTHHQPHVILEPLPRPQPAPRPLRVLRPLPAPRPLPGPRPLPVLRPLPPTQPIPAPQPLPTPKPSPAPSAQSVLAPQPIPHPLPLPAIQPGPTIPSITTSNQRPQSRPSTSTLPDHSSQEQHLQILPENGRQTWSSSNTGHARAPIAWSTYWSTFSPSQQSIPSVTPIFRAPPTEFPTHHLKFHQTVPRLITPVHHGRSHG